MANALRELGRGLNRAWEQVAEGWNELVNRSSAALTRFFPRKGESVHEEGGSGPLARFPRWGLLAGEVVDTGDRIVVKVEIPGVAREDCDVRIEEDNTLRIRGEKRYDREHVGESYYLMERAYGSFERVIPLPENVDADSARATYRDGVLKVELDKRERRRIRIA
jgi:HSP20 family protein